MSFWNCGNNARDAYNYVQNKGTITVSLPDREEENIRRLAEQEKERRERMQRDEEFRRSENQRERREHIERETSWQRKSEKEKKEVTDWLQREKEMTASYRNTDGYGPKWTPYRK